MNSFFAFAINERGIKRSKGDKWFVADVRENCGDDDICSQALELIAVTPGVRGCSLYFYVKIGSCVSKKD